MPPAPSGATTSYEPSRVPWERVTCRGSVYARAAPRPGAVHRGDAVSRTMRWITRWREPRASVVYQTEGGHDDAQVHDAAARHHRRARGMHGHPSRGHVPGDER